MPRKEREIELGEKAKRFTNVYVKNFNEAMTEEDLSKMFEKFGKITSLKVNIVYYTYGDFHSKDITNLTLPNNTNEAYHSVLANEI